MELVQEQKGVWGQESFEHRKHVHITKEQEKAWSGGVGGAWTCDNAIIDVVLVAFAALSGRPPGQDARYNAPVLHAKPREVLHCSAAGCGRVRKCGRDAGARGGLVCATWQRARLSSYPLRQSRASTWAWSLHFHPCMHSCLPGWFFKRA